MKLLAKLFLIVFVFTAFNSILAQNSANETVPVSVNLITGLSITHTSGDLSYGEVILDGTAQTPTKTPVNGALLTVAGHPGRDITVSFSSVTLTSGGNNLTFTPDVEYNSLNDNPSASTVTTGSTTALSGSGDGYLWVGGDLSIGATQAPGSYSGNFTLTVAY